MLSFRNGMVDFRVLIITIRKNYFRPLLRKDFDTLDNQVLLIYTSYTASFILLILYPHSFKNTWLAIENVCVTRTYNWVWLASTKLRIWSTLTGEPCRHIGQSWPKPRLSFLSTCSRLLQGNTSLDPLDLLSVQNTTAINC